jgi:hypothetical protein
MMTETGISTEDLVALHDAVRNLEQPGLAARLSSLVGTPIEMALQSLPRPWYDRLHRAAEDAIARAVEIAIAPMPAQAPAGSQENLMRGMGAASGAVGGMFGLPGLLIELPISTGIMLRAIADVARDEGENVHDPETRMACVQVFALGGRAQSDDAAETGYYGVRFALASSVSAAAEQIARQGLSSQGLPALARLVHAVATRFGVNLSQKAAAQLMPVFGAVGGATVNAIFIQHYQLMARGHFVIRRLESTYGQQPVKERYDSIAAALR